MTTAVRVGLKVLLLVHQLPISVTPLRPQVAVAIVTKRIQLVIGTPDMLVDGRLSVVRTDRFREPMEWQDANTMLVETKGSVGMDARGSIPVNQCVAAGCPVTECVQMEHIVSQVNVAPILLVEDKISLGNWRTM